MRKIECKYRSKITSNIKHFYQYQCLNPKSKHFWQYLQDECPEDCDGREEEIIFDNGGKITKYKSKYPPVKALEDKKEDNPYTRIKNIADRTKITYNNKIKREEE